MVPPEAAMTTFRWLHLTDLHLGNSDQVPYWPNMEEILFSDLNILREQVGPWDMVLITGDLTQAGTKPEFDEVDKLLLKFWSRFKKWGFVPELLAIPGNHDLMRPEDQSDPALLTLLHNWNLPGVQTPFWNNPDCPQRVLVSNAFQNYVNWWRCTPIPRPTRLNSGLLPGDCSASCKVGDFKLGIVGLNSAFLQLTGGDFDRRLNLDVRQLLAACNGNAAVWTTQHDLCLLLTHHPIPWLSAESQKHFSDEIHYPPERFALHHFGHMHDANLSSVSHGGSGTRRQLQGCSLFGLESWGASEVRKRRHGYSLCELKLDTNNNNSIALRVWPRRATELQGGGRKLVRDDSFDLVEGDGGTRPVVVKYLKQNQAIDQDQAIEHPTAPNTLISYDPRNAPFFVPYRQKGDLVVGRETALSKVRHQLTAGRRTAIGQTALFQGLGGLGKTQLAVEYAYRYRDAYPNGVIWLTADQDLDAQLVDLAVKAHWVAPASEHRHKLEVALHRLRSYSECLIILDNLEHPASIKKYLPEPPSEAHILVTSRSEQHDFTNVPIDVLDPDQSLIMLTLEAGRTPHCEAEWAAAREIARTLDGLPLALELAGAYLLRRPVSWQRYLELLQHGLKQALPPRIASLTGHEADLYSTLKLSESDIAEEPRLLDILNVLTWSGPAPMGQDLLAMLIGTADQAELTSALGLGTALRILRQVPGAERYALHRLVREVRREQCSLAERREWAANMCQRIGDWFAGLREDFLWLPRFEAEIDHLREWHDQSLTFAPEQACRLTWLQAYPPFHRSQHQEIKRLIELALVEYESHGCDDRLLLAHLYSDLAYALNHLGHPQRALELAEQAFAIRSKILGTHNADSARSLNNVGAAIHLLGRPKRALEVAEQVLEIYRGLFGEHHSDTARSLLNVAASASTLGDPERALRLAEQALAIYRGLFGELHPDTARSLSNVASYTNALGNPAYALELAEQAYATRRVLFGEHHPDSAHSLREIAAYAASLGEPRRALNLTEQVLSVHRTLFGENHPETARSLANVANYTYTLGEPKRALDLVDQALVIYHVVFGDHHPDYAMALFNKAQYLLSLGKPHPAHECAQRALEIEKRTFGIHHPETEKTATFLSQIVRPGFRQRPRKKSGGLRGKRKPDR